MALHFVPKKRPLVMIAATYLKKETEKRSKVFKMSLMDITSLNILQIKEYYRKHED